MTKRTIINTLALIALALTTTACPGIPWSDWDGPTPDTCDLTQVATASSIEVGREDFNGFRAWDDSERVQLEFGGQGGIMLPFQIRTSDDANTCLSMQVRLEGVDGELLADLAYPVQMYRQGDGTLVSNTQNLIFDVYPEGPAFLVVSVAGTTVAYNLELI